MMILGSDVESMFDKPKDNTGQFETNAKMLAQKHTIMKHLLSTKQVKPVVEDFLNTKRSEVTNIKTDNVVMERHIKGLEKQIERQNYHAEVVRNETVKEGLDAKALLEEKNNAKNEVTARTEKLSHEIKIITNENMKQEKFLAELNESVNTLVKELDQSLKLHDAFESDEEDESDTETNEDTDPATTSDAGLGTQLHHSFADSQQLVDRVNVLSQTVKSLNKICYMDEQTQTRLQRLFNNKVRELEKGTEKLASKVNAIKFNIAKLKTSIKELQQHVSKLKLEENNVLSEALDAKVSEVYRSCLTGKPIAENILKKMTWIENEVVRLLEVMEHINDRKFRTLRVTMVQERIKRQAEEKERQRLKKREERKKRHEQNVFDRVKKRKEINLKFTRIPGKKNKDVKLEISEEEEEPCSYLYSCNDEIKNNVKQLFRKKPEGPPKRKNSGKDNLKSVSFQPISSEDKLSSEDTSAVKTN